MLDLSSTLDSFFFYLTPDLLEISVLDMTSLSVLIEVSSVLLVLLEKISDLVGAANVGLAWWCWWQVLTGVWLGMQ